MLSCWSRQSICQQMLDKYKIYDSEYCEGFAPEPIINSAKKIKPSCFRKVLMPEMRDNYVVYDPKYCDRLALEPKTKNDDSAKKIKPCLRKVWMPAYKAWLACPQNDHLSQIKCDTILDKAVLEYKKCKRS